MRDLAADTEITVRVAPSLARSTSPTWWTWSPTGIALRTAPSLEEAVVELDGRDATGQAEERREGLSCATSDGRTWSLPLDAGELAAIEPGGEAIAGPP